jgi:hypothetical protein
VFADLVEDRGDVDDPPGATLEQVRLDGQCHEERSGQVDAQDLLAVLVVQVQHGLVRRDARVLTRTSRRPWRPITPWTSAAATSPEQTLPWRVDAMTP